MKSIPKVVIIYVVSCLFAIGGHGLNMVMGGHLFSGVGPQKVWKAQGEKHVKGSGTHYHK